ncbi:MAG: DUF4230 domain-containing protein [Bulleidia sp.]|nr:DUF4230 domain-containing protein [Erysipelotrichaceae bacterium]MDY2780840.1 DUF4230 domain-containing protein [Bulleidia sp.]
MKITKKIIKNLILVLVVAFIGAGAFIFGGKMKEDQMQHESKMTKFGFEDIGELATQEMIGTVVHTEKTAQSLFGMEIPFTQSQYIYSYDFDIKAGYDFSYIKYEIKDDEENKEILIYLPEAKILSTEILTDSFEVYYEKESIFKRITLSDNNIALKDMKKLAEDNAVSNGIYEKAKSNAEIILKAFFAQYYDLNVYTITFI